MQELTKIQLTTSLPPLLLLAVADRAAPGCSSHPTLQDMLCMWKLCVLCYCTCSSTGCGGLISNMPTPTPSLFRCNAFTSSHLCGTNAILLVHRSLGMRLGSTTVLTCALQAVFPKRCKIHRAAKARIAALPPPLAATVALQTNSSNLQPRFIPLAQPSGSVHGAAATVEFAYWLNVQVRVCTMFCSHMCRALHWRSCHVVR